ncbi:FeoB-associated Cys-rich membrane protein [Carboxylicivirga mesophila]|uniref:FeoB-associated Cys-rich membrane protein n=1 Tax=Carboxylicivirga mesophila TaxID=1166478 RepID=A0ABS5KD05_9BACT|nr:FeoB-associated Cys-rich membrane protein [Carboxylicivirga mesophila]MBS2212757.1 FeoB-associated Cys-rich membrane protein [Carboxylicivirga mesophila]
MNNKPKKVVIVLIIILGYVGYMFYSQIAHNKIKKDGRYTVGTVTDFKANFRNGYTVYYEFTVSGILYEQRMHVSTEYDNVIKHRFFVKYNPEYPRHNFIMLEKPALSKFWNSPSEGWKQIPH